MNNFYMGLAHGLILSFLSLCILVGFKYIGM